MIEIRTATIDDLDAIAAVEAECFPPAEAATREDFKERIIHYGNHFLLMFEDGKLISFVDGFVTNEPDLTDEMYADASMHDENGAWQMIFGVNTIPSRRRNGYAGQLIERMILDAKKQGRTGVVLTCKESKIHYYEKFGFVNEGVSESVHGGEVWWQMRVRVNRPHACEASADYHTPSTTCVVFCNSESSSPHVPKTSLNDSSPVGD